MFNARFYEWKKVDKSTKQPYYVYHKDGRPMKLAGLYDCWTDANGHKLFTCTIITTSPAPYIKWLHTRMPVILDDRTSNEWLEDCSLPNVEKFMVPYDRGEDITFHPVTKKLGNVQYQQETCADPVDINVAVSDGKREHHIADQKVDLEKNVKSEPPTSLQAASFACVKKEENKSLKTIKRKSTTPSKPSQSPINQNKKSSPNKKPKPSPPAPTTSTRPAQTSLLAFFGKK